MAKGPTTTKRLLFHKPDGTPYDFWIQSNFQDLTKDALTREIKEHGGQVIESHGEFPEHGFILLDALDPSPLYEVKTSFHKPINASFPYDRSKSAKATPLRHVLSHHFVEAVVEKGSWDRYDLLHWGFPARLPIDETGDPKAAAEKYTEEIQLGIDPEMEHGWVWATSRVFDSNDPAYHFTEEFKIVDENIESDPPVDNPARWKKWLRGRVVAECRLKQQLKFYLHHDISEDDQKTLITTILENGGSTCYAAHEADVILTACEVEMLEEDLDIMDWLQTNPRELAEDQTRTLIKFISWVDLCVQAGDWTSVDKKEADVARALRAHRRKLTATDKGKGRVTTAVRESSVGNKRKRTSEEPFTFAEEGSSPLKRRKQQRGETPKPMPPPPNGFGSKSGRGLLSNHSGGLVESRSASTIRPNRIFKGVDVPKPQYSPLKHDPNTTALILPSKSSARPDPWEISTKGQKSPLVQEPATSQQEKEYPFDSHQHSRVSATSILTVDTASSKVGNTTTNTTTTTGTAASARSVGPSFPLNAKQVGRPSTSAGTGTGALDNSLERSPRKSGQSTWSVPSARSELEEDDDAGEVILASFTSDRPKDAKALVEQSGRPVKIQLGEFERSLLECWREMSELGYQEGIDIIQDLVGKWPEIQRKTLASRDRKGKGRVSFHEPSKGSDKEQDYVPESDYDEGKTEPVSVKQPKPTQALNRQAYARTRGVSKTPDSAESSDEDVISEPEVNAERSKVRATRTNDSTAPASRAKPSPTVRKEPPSRKDAGSVNTSTRGQPNRSASQQPKVSRTGRKGITALNDADQNGEDALDLEEKDDLAPLPKSVKGRTQRKRGTSVVSEDESVTGEFRPRRGRSASVAPPEPISQRAPKSSNVEPGRPEVKYARKTTNNQPPKRK